MNVAEGEPPHLKSYLFSLRSSCSPGLTDERPHRISRCVQLSLALSQCLAIGADCFVSCKLPFRRLDPAFQITLCLAIPVCLRLFLIRLAIVVSAFKLLKVREELMTAVDAT